MDKSFRNSLLVATSMLLAFGMACRATKDTISPDTQELLVGGLLSSSGPAGGYGADSDKGARMAVEEVNALNRMVRIRYIALDDKSDKTEALKAARSLIEVNRVHVILGPTISPSALSVGKLAEDRQVPMVTTSATQDEITHGADYDRKFVFRVCFSDSFQGKVLARFAVNSLKLRTATIVMDKTLSYSIGLADTFQREFERLGGRVIQRESYSVSDSDFSALIDRVSQLDSDLLFIPGWDENVGPMLKQAGSKWKKFTLLGGDGWASQKLLELSGGNVGTSFTLSHFSGDDKSLLIQSFKRKYLERYGEEPSPLAALGYDGIYLIYDAAKRATSFSGSALRDALASTSKLELVTGTLNFDTYRNPQKDAFILKIEKTGFDFYERVQPNS